MRGGRERGQERRNRHTDGLLTMAKNRIEKQAQSDGMNSGHQLGAGGKLFLSGIGIAAVGVFTFMELRDSSIFESVEAVTYANVYYK